MPSSSRRPRPRAPAPDDEPDDAEDDGRQHGVVQVVQLVLDALPVVAHRAADERQRGDPGQAADEGEHQEAPEGHAGDARGQGDEGAGDGQAAGQEHGPVAPAAEPAVGRVQALGGDVQPAPAQEPLPALGPAHPVGDGRAHQVAPHPGQDHPAQAGPALADQEAAVEHDGLAGHRDAGALEDHEQEHGQGPVGPDLIRGEVDEGRRDVGHHEV